MAQQVVSDLLTITPLAQAERWIGRLSSDLPARIQAQWLQAIEADWQQRPEAREQPFSAPSYGSTPVPYTHLTLPTTLRGFDADASSSL